MGSVSKNESGLPTNLVENILESVAKPNVVNKKDLEIAKDEIITQVVAYIDKKGLGTITLHQHVAELSENTKKEIYNYVVSCMYQECMNGSNVPTSYANPAVRKAREAREAGMFA